MRLWKTSELNNKQIAIYALRNFRLNIIELELMIIVETDQVLLDSIFTNLIKRKAISEEYYEMAKKSKNMNIMYIKYLLAHHLQKRNMLSRKERLLLIEECRTQKNFYPTFIKDIMTFKKGSPN